MKNIKIYMAQIIILIFMSESIVFAWQPQPGTPLGDKVHPRIFIVPDGSSYFGIKMEDVRLLANRDSVYKGYIQTLIHDLDSNWYGKPLADDKIHITLNAINFSFLYLIDPSTVAGLTSVHTANEYGDEAIRQAIYLAGKMSEYTEPTGAKYSWIGVYRYNYGSSTMTGPDNIALAVVNDWVNDRVTQAQRETMVDAINNSYTHRPIQKVLWGGDHKFYGGSIEAGLGSVGFYGDVMSADHTSSLQHTFDASVGDMWLNGVVGLHNQVFDGARVIQGGFYDLASIKEIAVSVMAMSTALNTNYYEELHFLRDQVDYRLFMVNPRQNGDEPVMIGVADAARNAEESYLEWGRDYLEMNPIMWGLSGGPYDDNASVLKWCRDTAPNIAQHRSLYDTTQRLLLTKILFGDALKTVTEKTPSSVSYPLSKRMGNGLYMFRTGFESEDDTVVMFNAANWMVNYGGHGRPEFGQFKIYKYGDLTTTRNAAKVGIKRTTWFKHDFGNWISVFDPDTNAIGYRGGYDENAYSPLDDAWKNTGDNRVGRIKAEAIDNGIYDYVDYDLSEAWDDAFVDYAEREFVYLRSAGGTNDEYIIVYDRVNSIDANDYKDYQLQIPFDAIVYSDGVAQSWNGGDGVWIASGNLVESVNEWSENDSHGKIYSKPLLPSARTITRTGGPSHFFETIDGTVVYAPATLTDNDKNYMGSYTVRIRPTVAQNYDTFLNVMQIGDSKTLSAMTDTVGLMAVTVSSGNLVGAHIKDRIKNRIVLFNDQKRTDVPIQKAPYIYTCDMTAHSFHLLTNIEPYSTYRVSYGTTTVAEPTSSVDGVLSFSDTINSRGKIMYTIEKTGNAPAVLTIDQKDGMTVHSSPFMVTGSVTVTNGNIVKGILCSVTTEALESPVVVPVDGAWDSQCEKWTCSVPIEFGKNIITLKPIEVVGSSGDPISMQLEVKRDNLCACP